ncbi:hypothetical protein ACWGI8_31430 [Streptomyces sp. NPDC054841]
MRTSWRSASALGVLVAFLWPVPSAASQARGESAPQPFGADCSVYVEGSRATAYCHNPYLDTDRIQLHVECERWWDVDADSKPVDLGPTERAELSERCWKEIRTVWVSHLRRPS